MSGWEGIKVRNTRTGKTGEIRGEYQGFGFRGLEVVLDGGGQHYMELCTIGPDRFTRDWEWYAEPHGERKGKWIPFTEKKQK